MEDQKKTKNFSGSLSVDEFITQFGESRNMTQEQINTLYRLRAEGKLY